jgi:hypothetical protein
MVQLQYWVPSGSDDGYIYTFEYHYYPSLTYVDVGTDNAEGFAIWLRWTGITIPANAIITESHIQMAYNGSSGGSTGRIYFDDVASTAAPTSYADFFVKSATKSSNYVDWTLPTSAGVHQSPDITSIINETISNYGPYTNGNMMAFIFGVGSGFAYTRFSTYEAGLPAVLEINYIIPTSGGAQFVGL